MKRSKKIISMLLAIIMAVSIMAGSAFADYYKKYTGSSGSIVTALNSVGATSTYAYRAKIAAANGISNYTGTAAQNTKLLNLLKQGKLVIPGTTTLSSNSNSTSYYAKYTGNSGSIVTALNSLGITSTYAYRAKIAAANGISNYSGTAAQNTQLLNLLKQGKLKKPTSSTTGSNTNPTTKPTSGSTSSTTTTSGTLVSTNLSKVNFIGQSAKSCKATSAAMAVNLILGKNAYKTSDMVVTGSTYVCANLKGNNYKGSNGITYTPTYMTDHDVCSLTELKNQIETAIANGLPIVVAVHKKTVKSYHESGSGRPTAHHWVVVVGKNSNGDYLVVDPAQSGSGTMAKNTKTMSVLGYELGLFNSPVGSTKLYYGYISFSKK